MGLGFGVEFGGFLRQWPLVEMDRRLEVEEVVVVAEKGRK